MIISSEELNYALQEIILNSQFLSIELPDSYDVVFGCQGLLNQLYYICRQRLIIYDYIWLFIVLYNYIISYWKLTIYPLLHLMRIWNCYKTSSYKWKRTPIWNRKYSAA